jgi:DNA modification methylase
MSARVIQGSVFDVLPTIAPGSVDCVVTSPPYWMLRSYLAKGHALKKYELGSEPTPAVYVESMVKVFRLVRDCMADHATCWLNIGDTYSATQGANNSNLIEWSANRGRGGGRRAQLAANLQKRQCQDIQKTSLCLIPQRLAIALQDDGWIVRSVIVWRKPAPMPSSVSGWSWRRCRVKVRSHWTADNPHPAKTESGVYQNQTATNAQWSDCPGCAKCKPNDGLVLRKGSWRPTSSWEPILFLAKSPGYYSDGEAVKQPAASATIGRNEYGHAFKGQFVGSPIDERNQDGKEYGDGEFGTATANLRDVWQMKLTDLSKDELIDLVRSMGDGSLADVFRIASEPLKEKHYAAFPTELVHRCLKAGTSARGYCPACGLPWVRVVKSELSFASGSGRSGNDVAGKNGHALQGGGDTGDIRKGPLTSTETLGFRPACRCDAGEPRPPLVLDPFCGSGRTLIEAMRLGCDGVGCELNPDYVAMAERLLREESPLFASREPAK